MKEVIKKQKPTKASLKMAPTRLKRKRRNLQKMLRRVKKSLISRSNLKKQPIQIQMKTKKNHKTRLLGTRRILMMKKIKNLKVKAVEMKLKTKLNQQNHWLIQQNQRNQLLIQCNQ